MTLSSSPNLTARKFSTLYSAILTKICVIIAHSSALHYSRFFFRISVTINRFELNFKHCVRGLVSDLVIYSTLLLVYTYIGQLFVAVLVWFSALLRSDPIARPHLNRSVCLRPIQR